ncbi:hypothetical protein [Mycobacteroides abscessus]|uniref:hypothetical protein n=1 Tax=Mycobacteroides abscessus TaxID=36809 RepID=UPI0009A5A1DD|nr:hypothetical protein [Mycobacteroides abscessus]
MGVGDIAAVSIGEPAVRCERSPSVVDLEKTVTKSPRFEMLPEPDEFEPPRQGWRFAFPALMLLCVVGMVCFIAFGPHPVSPWIWMPPIMGTISALFGMVNIGAEPTRRKRIEYLARIDGDRTPEASPGRSTSHGLEDRQRRIAGVQEALGRLDREWLDYEMDWAAYSLTKPLLHVGDVPQTLAYNEALYELRELAAGLTDESTTAQVGAAERAADRALRAWDVANDHARAVGVEDRSPSERRALRRLHHLVNTLADPSTPQAMWGELIDGIDVQITNLKTVAMSWSHLLRLPQLESGQFVHALEQRAASLNNAEGQGSR